MSQAPLSPFKAARDLITVIRAYNQNQHLTRIELDQVREILPQIALGKGIRTISAPQELDSLGFEGALLRDPNDSAKWGILYNGAARPERQRFTIAHELGHLVLHRHQSTEFHCSKQDVHLSLDASKKIEREADEFAANLLMPGDSVSTLLSGSDVDFHRLSEAATEFGVSLEAVCLRFVKYTPQRVILIHWDNGFLNYHWRSDSAVKTRARLPSTVEPLEPAAFPHSVAADENIEQEWVGETLAANLWCPDEPPQIKVRECKHSSSFHERVLTLLFFEDAEPPKWKTGWEEDKSTDSFDRLSPSVRIVGTSVAVRI